MKKQAIAISFASVLLAIATLWAATVVAGYFLGWLAHLNTDTTRLVAGLGWIGPAVAAVVMYKRNSKLD